MPLTVEEEQRYSRHLILPGVGLAGQERLKQSRVLLVGAGGLGSPVALYLAAAGIGTIGIADADMVEVTNLQRQVLHTTDRIGEAKVTSAAKTLSALNPLTTIEQLPFRVSAENALDLITQYDVVVDGCDNFPTRYLLNDACALTGRPLVFGSVFRFEGQTTVFDARSGPCYRCLFPDPPDPDSVPSCAEGGVLGVLPGLIGMIQATETIKILLQLGETLLGRLLSIDAKTMRFREVCLRKNPDCPLCGDMPTITHLVDYQEYCTADTLVQLPAEREITPQELSSRLADPALCLVDVREDWEHDDSAGFATARHIPYSRFTRCMHELDSSKEIVVYCATGARSWHAVNLLITTGFTRVKHLKGGLAACKKPLC